MSRKRGGCGSFFMGFLVGFLSLIIVVAGAGTWAYFALNLKTVEKIIKVEVPVGNDEFKELPLKDLIKVISDAFGNSGELTYGKLEDDYGITLPDKIGSVDLSKVKTAIRDCGLTDFGSMFKSVSVALSIEDVMVMMGSEVPSSLAGIKAYKLNDLLGTEDGLGFQGILEEVSIGDLMGIDPNASDKPSDVQDVLWLLRNYTLLGSENGIQNMASDLSLVDLSAMGIDVADNDMLKSIATTQRKSEEGFLQFEDDKGAIYSWKDGGLERADGTPAQSSDFVVYPKSEGENLVYNAENELIFVSSLGELTYDAVEEKYFDASKQAVTLPGGNRLAPALYKLSELGQSVNSLTLGELLGDQLPSALVSFKNTRLDSLGELGISNFYFTDLAEEGTTGILRKLADQQGSKLIDLDGDGQATDLAKLLRSKDKNTVYYDVDETLYVKDADKTYSPATGVDRKTLDILSYSVEDVNGAIDELTLGDVLTTVPDAFSAFAHVEIGKLSEQLTIENIYFTDLVTPTTEGIFAKLGSMQGEKKIDLAGDGTADDLARLWRSKDKVTIYYEVGKKLYLKNDDGSFSPDKSGVKTGDLDKLSYSVANVNSAIDELKLSDVLSNVPPMLSAFADVSIKDLASKLTIENIYLSDVIDETTTGILANLAGKQGKVKIDVLGDGTADDLAKLWRSKDKSTIYYQVNGTLYVKNDDGTYSAADTSIKVEDLDKLSHSIKEMQGAIDEMTVEELIGPLTGTFACLNGTTIKDLPDRLTKLTIADIFPDQVGKGVLSLLDPTTTLDGIPDAMKDAMQNKTLSDLQKAGIIDANLNLEKTLTYPDGSGGVVSVKIGDLKLNKLIEIVVALAS